MNDEPRHALATLVPCYDEDPTATCGTYPEEQCWGCNKDRRRWVIGNDLKRSESWQVSESEECWVEQ